MLNEKNGRCTIFFHLKFSFKFRPFNTQILQQNGDCIFKIFKFRANMGHLEQARLWSKQIILFVSTQETKEQQVA